MTPLEAMTGSPARARVLQYLAHHEDQIVKAQLLAKVMNGSHYVRYMRRLQSAGLVDKLPIRSPGREYGHLATPQYSWVVEPHPLWAMIRATQ